MENKFSFSLGELGLSLVGPPGTGKPLKYPCPNCGNIFHYSQLFHSSTCQIVVESGSVCSTLYGVCSECADRHSKQSNI